MKINFKQPKFVLPLIILPFLIILFFVFHGSGKPSKAELAKADSANMPGNKGFNSDLPGTSKDIDSANLKDKMQAALELNKRLSGETAMQIDPNTGEPIDLNNQSIGGGAYTQDEIAKIKAQKTMDSLQRALRSGQGQIDRQLQYMQAQGGAFKANSNVRSTTSNSRRDNDIALQIQRMQQQNNNPQNFRQKNEYQEDGDDYHKQMKLFREQMGLVDSLQKSADEKNEVVQGGKKRKSKNSLNIDNPEDFDPNKNNQEKPLHVSIEKSKNRSFNTIRKVSEDNNVAAMIDQDIKVSLGSRVRLRLLQDIYIGDYLVRKGNYLFGIVTGFQTQRVNISISQIMYNNTPLPVKMDLYDNDGYLGLYVPGSNFREFTKQIGSQGTQGLSQIQTPDQSTITTSLMQTLFNSTSTTLSNLVKQNKAKLKYNYTIYLKENKY